MKLLQFNETVVQKKKKKHLVQLKKQNTKYVMYEMIQSVILDLTNYFDKKRKKKRKDEKTSRTQKFKSGR